MRRFQVATIIMAFLIFPIQASAQALPEGVTFDVIATYASDIPGVERVELQKFTLAPGAKLENFPVENVEYCTSTQGIIRVTDETTGDTNIYAAGSRWQPKIGHKASVSNPGTELHVHWIYAFVLKK